MAKRHGQDTRGTVPGGSWPWQQLDHPWVFAPGCHVPDERRRNLERALGRLSASISGSESF
jgi:hypothetical protein